MGKYEIRVDPALFPSIAEYYQRQRVDLNKTKTYLVQHCTLEGATGFLLSFMQPTYNDARDKMFSAVDSFDQAIEGLAEQVKGYAGDVAHNEDDLQQQITELEARVKQLENDGATASGPQQAPPAGPPSWPTAPTPPSGGGMPSPQDAPGPIAPEPLPDAEGQPEPEPAPLPEGDLEPERAPLPEGNVEPETDPGPEPEPVAPLPEAEGPIVNIDIDVTIVNDTVTVNVGDGSNVIVGDGNTMVIDPALLAAREAEQNAREAALYEQLWQERAVADPLGRTADELRLAWESREPVPLEEVPTGESSLGYVTQAPPGREPIRFEIYLPEFASTSAPIGATP